MPFLSSRSNVRRAWPASQTGRPTRNQSAGCLDDSHDVTSPLVSGDCFKEGRLGSRFVESQRCFAAGMPIDLAYEMIGEAARMLKERSERIGDGIGLLKPHGGRID